MGNVARFGVFKQVCRQKVIREDGRGIQLASKCSNKCAGTRLYVKIGEEYSRVRSVQTNVQAQGYARRRVGSETRIGEFGYET